MASGAKHARLPGVIMRHGFTTGQATVLPMERGEVFFDGIFSEPRLQHPEGLAIGPDGWIQPRSVCLHRKREQIRPPFVTLPRVFIQRQLESGSSIRPAGGGGSRAGEYPEQGYLHRSSPRIAPGTLRPGCLREPTACRSWLLTQIPNEPSLSDARSFDECAVLPSRYEGT